MRLLHTKDITLHEFNDDDVPKYAILSHTWGSEEIKFQEMINPSKEIRAQKGYEKILEAASIAKKADLDYVWVDTCCIDKTSSSELSEAINSMFIWYKRAEICIVYMADVNIVVHGNHGKDNEKILRVIESFVNSRWFKRGWTLQELIAPQRVSFFSRDWVYIGTKPQLADDLSKITSIPVSVLKFGLTDSISVAQKMSWASSRETTRPEDLAYCLLGIFDVNMPLLYGEGDKAFIRLQEEIIKRSDDQTIFCWTDNDSHSASLSGLLATSPSLFKACGEVKQWQNFYPFENDPYTVTNAGLQITFPLLPIMGADRSLTKLIHSVIPPIKLAPEENLYVPLLSCTLPDLTPISIFIRRLEKGQRQFSRVMTNRKVLLNRNVYSWKDMLITQTVYIRQSIRLPLDYISHRIYGFKIRLTEMPTGITYSIDEKRSGGLLGDWTLDGDILRPCTDQWITRKGKMTGALFFNCTRHKFMDQSTCHLGNFYLIVGCAAGSYPWWNIHLPSQEPDLCASGPQIYVDTLPILCDTARLLNGDVVELTANSGLYRGNLLLNIDVAVTPSGNHRASRMLLGIPRVEIL